ncbi:MAG TPA: MarR family transcriptional regulator [Flavobacterium sp.]|uniref:MarR family winged helix-turn-helix transcriptional regulator n=1 Tax=unclassified Flavobacterium TaxID=196869 RepID=UPI0025C46096|nr:MULTISPECIES: MarR family transcriptional regulator [unclassified Flavobacterium]HRE77910.1 MarR family transcriptional regulator [Flavobacterium sp.]
MEKISSVIFYSMDQSIRTYRMFAQKRLKENGLKITIDQWLVLKTINENPDIAQNELADMVFKDNASVTRIIELLVKSDYLERKKDQNDRRKSVLKITKLGSKTIEKVYQVVQENRQIALTGINQAELEIVDRVLKKISQNCK